MSDTASEDAVRDGLSRAAEEISPREDLYDRVRLGVRRRRNRRLGGGLVAIALVAIGAGVAQLGASSPAAPTAISAVGTTSQCPTAIYGTVPRASMRPGTDQVLVPGTPIYAVACDYQGPPGAAGSSRSGPAPGVVSRSISLTGTQLAAVVAALQEPIHPYTFRCPYSDTFAQLTIDFQYSTGPDVTVFVSLGCTNLSNGTISGAFHQNGPMLPPAIQALTQ